MKKTLLTSLSLIIVSSSVFAADPLSSEKSGKTDECSTGITVTDADQKPESKDDSEKANLLNPETK